MAKYLKKCCVYIPQRFLVCGLIFAASAICIMDRQAYFHAVSAMVYIPTPEGESKSQCPAMIDSGHKNYDDPQSRFYWDRRVKRAVTQAFYIGLLISNVPAGCVADQYGGRGVLTVGVLVGSLITLLLPTLAIRGPTPLLFARLIQGVGQGLVFSSTHSLIAQWAPTSERSIFVGITQSGVGVGWGMGSVMHYVFAERWQMPFYLTGALGLLWVTVFYLLSSSKPSQSVYIKDTELQYILNNREGLTDQTPQGHHVPWKEVFTSLPVWSLLFISWGFRWTYYSMGNHFNYYIISIMKVTEDLSQSSLFGEAVVGPTSNIFWSFVSDYLVNHKYMSRTANRKLFGLTCNMLTILCLLAIPLAGCSGLTVFSVYVILCYLRGLYFSTVYANPIDLSPRHAGLLMALIYSTGNVTGLFSREVVSVIDTPSDISQWWFVYLWMIAQLAVFSPPYLCFGSAEIQSWNSPEIHTMRSIRSLAVLQRSDM